MKIVHICLCGPYNDGWSYQENCLSYYHKKMKNEVTIITTPFINDKKSVGYIFYKTGEYYDENGIKIIRKPLKFSNKSKIIRRFRMYKGLYESIVKEEPDILFVHGLQFVDIRYVKKYAKNNPKVKVYVDGHEDFNNSARTWISKYILHGIIWRWCAKEIEEVTCKFWGVTPARVDFLKEMYKLPQEKVQLLVMGADDEKVKEAKIKSVREHIRMKLNVREDEFLIISGGKIDQNKPQVLMLMEAIKEMNIENTRLIIFGSVSSELENKFKENLCEVVNYIGWIEPKETYKYFNAAELVVFPGLHSVFWEQVVGLGKPCVFRHMKGFEHIDVGGNCEFLYEDSIDEIKEVLIKIISNNELYEHMKSVSISKGMDVFSYKKIAKRSIERI